MFAVLVTAKLVGKGEKPLVHNLTKLLLLLLLAEREWDKAIGLE